MGHDAPGWGTLPRFRKFAGFGQNFASRVGVLYVQFGVPRNWFLFTSNNGEVMDENHKDKMSGMGRREVGVMSPFFGGSGVDAFAWTWAKVTFSSHALPPTRWAIVYCMHGYHCSSENDYYLFVSYASMCHITSANQQQLSLQRVDVNCRSPSIIINIITLVSRWP